MDLRRTGQRSGPYCTQGEACAGLARKVKVDFEQSDHDAFVRAIIKVRENSEHDSPVS